MPIPFVGCVFALLLYAGAYLISAVRCDYVTTKHRNSRTGRFYYQHRFEYYLAGRLFYTRHV